MYEYKDLKGLTRLTVGAMGIYLVGELTAKLGLLANAQQGASPDTPLAALVALAALLELAALILCGILFLCWIYRANANAQLLGGGLSDSPGWAVGWFFVPFANLFKPFLAIKEIWLASHFGSNWVNGEATSMLRWWWGLWLTGGIVSYVGMIAKDSPRVSASLYLMSGVLFAAATFFMIRIMLQVRDAQTVTRHAEVFT